MRVFIAAWALLAATSLAWPADSIPPTNPAPDLVLPPPPVLPHTWEGFYLRGSSNLGLATGQATANPFDSLLTPTSPGSLSGGITGGAFGANWQTGSALVGFEGDMQWSSQSTGAFSSCGLGCSLNDRVKVPWLATLRARAGTTFDRLYVYGTGGFASLGTSDNLNPAGDSTTPNFVALSTSNIDWTVGAGMELALDRNMSAKLEYLYMPSTSPVGTLTLFDSTVLDPVKNNIVRGGINYRLPIGDQ